MRPAPLQALCEFSIWFPAVENDYAFEPSCQDFFPGLSYESVCPRILIDPVVPPAQLRYFRICLHVGSWNQLQQLLSGKQGHM
jgi:hypothetical protein